MHVVLLNQAFYPDVVATAQMGKDLADELVRRGHTVSAIASRSIYGRKGASLSRREEVGVAGGQQGDPEKTALRLEDSPPLPEDGERKGSGVIHVSRVGMSVFGKAGIAARMADFGLFYVLALGRLLTMERPDVVVCFTTPPFVGLAGIVCRCFRGSRAVLWEMDLYPEVPIAFGLLRPRGVAARLLKRVHRWLLRQSDATVVLGRCMLDRVLEAGAREERTVVIPVWADEVGVRSVPHGENPVRRDWGLGDELCVMYSGNLGLGHDAATICEAMDRLKSRADIRFVFVGSGKRRAEVEAFIKERVPGTASYRDYVPREQLALSLSAGDVHLISLREDMTGLIVPSKLYGIMAAGRAAIFVGSPMSEIGRVVEESGCGLVVRPGDGEGLARAIERLAADPALALEMGRRGRAAFEESYTKGKLCARWMDLVEGFAPARAGVNPGRTGTV